MTRSPPDSARESWPTEEEPARINRGGSPRLAPRMAAHCAGSFGPYLKGYSETIGRHRPGVTQPGERSYLDE
jgi:hypothetical protein